MRTPSRLPVVDTLPVMDTLPEVTSAALPQLTPMPPVPVTVMPVAFVVANALLPAKDTPLPPFRLPAPAPRLSVSEVRDRTPVPISAKSPPAVAMLAPLIVVSALFVIAIAAPLVAIEPTLSATASLNVSAPTVPVEVRLATAFAPDRLIVPVPLALSVPAVIVPVPVNVRPRVATTLAVPEPTFHEPARLTMPVPMLIGPVKVLLPDRRREPLSVL